MTPHEREDCIRRIVDGFQSGLEDQGALLDDFIAGMSPEECERLGMKAAYAAWLLRRRTVREV